MRRPSSQNCAQYLRKAFLLCALATAGLTASPLEAATVTWLGNSSTNFEDPLNWSSLPAGNLTSDVAAIGAGPAAFQPQLTANRSISGLAFPASAGGWTLSSVTPGVTLQLGTSGISLAGQTSGVNTISANLFLGANQTWSVGSGGSLRVTGSLAAGISANATFAGQIFIAGNASSGEIVWDPASGREVALYSTLANSGAVVVNSRLVLGSAANSTSSVNTFFNSASAGFRISNTGAVDVRSGTWRTNDCGSNNTGAFTGTLNVSGGTFATGGARYMGQINGSTGTRIHVNGGTFVVTGGGNTVTNAGYFGLGTHGASTPNGTVTMNVTSGLVDIARGTGTLPTGVVSAAMTLGGVGNTTVLVNQTGGTVRVGLSQGSDVFTGVTNNNTFTNLSIGSQAVSNNAAYTLAGGTLFVAGSVQGVTSPGGVSNFNLLGGTLAAATFNATLLGHSPSATVSANQTASSASLGTLVNRGGTLAPGGEGTAGRTVLTGNYSATSGTLAIDIGGTTQASGFQTGQYDFLSITGSAALGGNLSFNVLPGFTPSANQTFTILTATGGLSGAFANAPSGQRVVSANGLATFVVTQTANSLALGQYLPVTAPTIGSVSSPTQVLPGDTAVLGVTANSLAPVTYEWRKDSTVLPGETGSSLTLTNLQPEDSGTYEVTVRNAAGAVTRTFSLVVATPPSTQRLVVDAGGNRTFSANPGAASYRWILDGEDAATTRNFTYTPVRRDVGTHWIRAVETYSDNSTITRHWAVRVRIPIPAPTTIYHVSPTGSDSNNGSAGAPFRTLERARDVIRALPRPLPGGGVIVYLRDGIHRRTSTFTLNATDSGTETAPVIYAAFPGENPILTTAKLVSSSQIQPLASSEHSRVAPGIDPARIWEISVAGNTRANAFPNVFNEWVIFNALRSSQNGGLLEVFNQGERLRLSRYPNHNLTNDILTASLSMNGVATGAATDGTGYLNGAGNYTMSNGTVTQVGGAFHYSTADATRIARWQTAISRGGLWLMGYWRVPWQLNGVRVSVIDPGKQVIGLVTNSSNASAALVSLGIGNKYSRPVGSRSEPYWVVNLLEEMDQTGEWAIDFSRQRLYVLTETATPPADGALELSDVGTPLIQVNTGSDIIFQGLTMQRHLGIGIQVTGGTRVLVAGCNFRQIGNMVVDINGGTNHGVISSNFDNLASGGVMLRGGQITPTMVAADHFAVNNKFRSFGEVVRVYQAAVDVGFGGPLGSWGQPTVGMRVAHNDIRSSPHAGILWNGYQNIIEYNEISDFTRISNDLGAIYRFGPNIDARTIIRYNHIYSSPQGEGIYNDLDHIRTPIYGNTVNLKTPTTSSRGYGFWTTTNTEAGKAVLGIPMTLNIFNNISVNGRDSYFFHSQLGGRIENNVSFRALDTASPINWRLILTDNSTLTHSVRTSNATVLASGPNTHYTSDPGFIDFANDDLRLRPDSRVYREMPGFVPIPVEMAGLDPDEFRADSRTWTPFVVTGNASVVGSNTATFTGTLVYPQFDPNATVWLYWGTSDGGTDPAGWQNATSLGTPGSGTLLHTRSDLAPATRYYFRFYAVNTAGEHWAEQTNSTTTFPADAVTGGNASATSGTQSAANAFDGSAGTVWQTTNGTTTATLTYALPGTTPVRVTQYQVTSAPDTPANDPRDWTFEGSYDGTTWIVLDTQTGQTFSSRGQVRTYGFSTGSSFRFFRLVVTANNGGSALQLAELRLFAPNLTPDTTPPVISTPGNMTVSGSATGATVFFEVSADDAVSGNVPATAVPPSGSFFPIGTTTVNVTASDAAGNPSSASFTVTVTAPPLPAPWTIQQIRPYSGVAAGNATVLSANSFRIVGAGGASTGGTTGDLWTGTNDSNTYVSMPWQGDGVFTARLQSFTSTDSSAKAGIIFRETTNTGSRYSTIYVIRNSGGSVLYQHKTATSGSSTNVNFFNGSVSNRGIPEWLRLVRQGDTFTLFYSEDGAAWTQLGTPHVNAMAGSQLSVGFVVAPRTGNTTATAVFDNIKFQTPIQIWQEQYFGAASSGNAVLTADPDGDGSTNLLEYALGTSPVAANAPVSLIPEIHENRLTLTFDRTADPQITYRVEAANSLVPPDWAEIWQSTGAANSGGAVTVPDVIDLSTSPGSSRFLRLRVTSP